MISSPRRSWAAIVALALLLQMVGLSASWASHLELGQVEASTNVVGDTADYEITFRIGGGNGDLPAGAPTIRITFPPGYGVSSTDTAFDEAASGVRDGDSGPFDAFPSHGQVDVVEASREVFIRDLEHATLAGTTMFRVVVTDVMNATVSGNGSVGISVLTPEGGTNTNGFVSFELANGPLASFAVTDADNQPLTEQTAGQSFDIRVRALDAFGNAVDGTAGGNSFEESVDISSNVSGSSGLATTPALVAGILPAHSLTLTEASDAAATLTATRTEGSETGTSASFTVTPGPVDHLAIRSQPRDAGAGSILSPAPKVEVRDAFGNHVTDDSGTVVTVSLLGGPDGAVLGGATSRESVDGVATFDDLAVQPAAPDYVLRFSASGLDAIDSVFFAIGQQVPEIAVGPVTSTENGFVFEVVNHDDRYLYSVESEAGSVSIDATGQVTVTGLDPGEEATVLVLASARPGSSDLGSAATTVTGTAVPEPEPDPVSDAGPGAVLEEPVVVDGQLPSLAHGSVLLLVDGVEQQVVVTRNDDATALILTGAGFDLQLSVTTADGTPRQLDSEGRIVLASDELVAVSGDGFAPDSGAAAWLFSTPSLLGRPGVDADGAFSAELPLPEDIEPGSHTLQVNGLGPDSQIRSLSLGVAVLADPTPLRLPDTGGDTAQLILAGLLLAAAGSIMLRRHPAPPTT